jgi:acyl carrier protein
MENIQIKERIRKILIKVLKHENFEMNDEMSAKDVAGWDSLTHMVIITEIEDDFKVKFKLKELNKLKNLSSLVDLVKSKL